MKRHTFEVTRFPDHVTLVDIDAKSIREAWKHIFDTLDPTDLVCIGYVESNQIVPGEER